MKILNVRILKQDLSVIQESLSGYELLNAPNVEEALKYLEKERDISLVIIDLEVPDTSTFQLINTVNSDSRYTNVRTIILTREDQLEDETIGLRFGASDYVHKPISKEVLNAHVKTQIDLLAMGESEAMSSDNESSNVIFWQSPMGIAVSYQSEPGGERDSSLTVNPMFEKITGWTREELSQFGWARITHPDDLDKDLVNFKKLQSGEIRGYSMEKRYLKPDKSEVWVHMIVAPLSLTKENIFKHVCLIQDITQRKNAETALVESERSKSVFLAKLPGMAYRCTNDRDWTMHYVSGGCATLTGYTPLAMLYSKEFSYNDVIVPEYRKSVWAKRAESIVKNQPFESEYEIITITGDRKWVMEKGQVVSSETGNLGTIEGIILDISDRKKIEAELYYHNNHDMWTGLHNRKYFEHFLQEYLTSRNKKNKAVISVNLSAIHLLRMRHGALYALNLLRKIVESMENLSSENHLLFYPQEFQLVFSVITYHDKNELVSFCQSISNTLEPLLADEKVGWGIGVVEIDASNSRDSERLITNLIVASEKALADFDRSDSHWYLFNHKLENQINREKTITAELSEIVAGQNSDRLFLHFQPILDLKTNKIDCFEALARFNSGTFGMVSPLEFIPIAEKSKLIIPLGMQIIRQALQFLHTIKEQGHDAISISINVSIIQLLHRSFVQELTEAIKEIAVSPADVTLEVTESIFSVDFEGINTILGALGKSGIQIALDDFGTGYSSLARERELNVSYLKIDKFFIDKLLELPEEKTITVDIISMAHKLGHIVIAEGVEDERQMQYLQKHGCDMIQGYLISKPLDSQGAVEFLNLAEGGNQKVRESI